MRADHRFNLFRSCAARWICATGGACVGAGLGWEAAITLIVASAVLLAALFAVAVSARGR